MKIRLGFVSNSSSASYYVTIKGSPTEILKTILEECWYPFTNYDQLLSKVNEEISTIEQRMSSTTEQEDYLLSFNNLLKGRLKNSYDSKKLLTDNEDLHTKPEFVKVALHLNNIQYEEIPDVGVKLTAETIMHNSYTEGMPEMLQEIVLYYSFGKPTKLILEIENDN